MRPNQMKNTREREKKIRPDEKKKVARERNNNAEYAKAARIVSDMGELEAEKEDQYWREAEGPKSRAARRCEERAEKRAEAAAKKAEARKLLEEEEKAMRPVRKKVTEVEWLRIKEEIAMRRDEELEKERSRALDTAEYLRIVDEENVNRAPVYVDPRSVVAAINFMGIDPKKRRRRDRLFKDFARDKLPTLKAEAPSLSRNQYWAMLWKRWNKVAKLATDPRNWEMIV